jgi:hypothetical protein
VSTVINIRGTGGSGKSTLVRRVMELYASHAYIPETGRRQPIASLHTRGHNDRALFVPGHYNTACGGCDTIKTPDQVYSLVNDAVDRGVDVLYEGIMVMDDTRRAIELHQRLENQNAIHGFTQPRHRLHVVYLTTPIEVCLAGINERRWERMGPEKYKPVNPKNTTDRAKRAEAGLLKLEAAGVAVHRLDRAAALAQVRELLGLPS